MENTATTTYLTLTPAALKEFKEDIIQAVKIATKEAHHKAATSKEWMNEKEVCDVLAISRTCLDNWIGQGRLVKYKVGTRNRYKREEVQAVFQQLESKRNRP